jgi:glyoxylase-like metal-dependent hydrolase (beta-lactamase superfamily II)
MRTFFNNFFATLLIFLNIVKPAPTGRVDENLLVVKTGAANFYLYQKDGETIALDAGYGVTVIRRELSKLGIAPEAVSALFLSHSDFDHAGGHTVFPNARIYLSRGEEPLVGRKMTRKFGIFCNKGFQRPCTLLDDNDTVTAGSITVRAISTPGHTPGSMSYLIDGSTLFVGDALRVIRGRARPIPFFSMDKKQTKASIQKLAALEGVERLLTGHRGIAFSCRNILK